tara:strand:+ start:87 stop:503 length:417 start_codon:yes stop_codon:yes gene_type:complete
MTKICCNHNIRIVGKLKQIYTHDNKQFLNLFITDDNVKKILEIEAAVLEQYPSVNNDLKLISNVEQNLFRHLKIPMKYNAIIINIQTRNGKRLLFEHLEKDMDIACKILCNYVYETSYNELKITWSIDHIIANCIYTT